jgi:hypothetical protein
MQTYRQIIGSAGSRLLNHPVGELPHVKHYWNQGVTWKPVDTNGQTDAQASDSADEVVLYPVLQAKEPSQADYAVLREFGILLLRKAGANGKERWEKKLCLPMDDQIDAVQGKLDQRCAYKSYEELVTSFSTALDRLVALNITNALLANGVGYSNSNGVKLKTWGATEEYCTRKRFHSIIPLVSAYSTRDVLNCYGCAFAEMLVNKLLTVRESSTSKALEAIVRSIAELAK